MKLMLLRRRWLLLIACLTVAIAVIWWQSPVQSEGRFTRKQYDRIRLGMTPAEVGSVMECPGANGDLLRDGLWETVASDGLASTASIDLAQTWLDEFVIVRVCYWDGKAIAKAIETPVPPWKLKCRACLYWLRGLVGL
jgi:hypothetical protein